MRFTVERRVGSDWKHMFFWVLLCAGCLAGWLGPPSHHASGTVPSGGGWRERLAASAGQSQDWCNTITTANVKSAVDSHLGSLCMCVMIFITINVWNKMIQTFYYQLFKIHCNKIDYKNKTVIFKRHLSIKYLKYSVKYQYLACIIQMLAYRTKLL